MCFNEANEHEKTLSTIIRALRTSKNEETMNALHGETVKLHDGYISMHECRKYVFHSTYTHACTATYYIKEVSMGSMGKFLKYKLDFEQ